MIYRMAVTLQCGAQTLSLDRPHVMGILNVTPDSFSDGGRFTGLDEALKHAVAMVSAGASIIDVGGESTRPGAAEVSEQEELDRVIPVIEAIRGATDVIVSIDSSKASVMEQAARSGAGFINDVRALEEPGSAEMAAKTGLPVCLMHMKGTPATMQSQPSYLQVVEEVVDYLSQRTMDVVGLGIPKDQILWDPGFGFGKTANHNLQLLKGLKTLCDHSAVLIGLSRKRLMADILDNPAADRTVASVTAATLCVQQGASIVRVHDVQQTVDALKVLRAAELGCLPA